MKRWLIFYAGIYQGISTGNTSSEAIEKQVALDRLLNVPAKSITAIPERETYIKGERNGY